jgi:hypothetical protein
MDRKTLPLPWNQALLAIVPGIVATAASVGAELAASTQVVVILLAAYLFSAYWWSGRRFPPWSLMAAGMLASLVLTTASGVIGGLAAVLVGSWANVLVLVALTVALGALLRVPVRAGRVPRLAWALLAAIIVCQLAVRVKYFALYGASWSVAGQWLNVSLYAAVVGLLVPVALGLPPARRYGPAAMTFAIGALYGGFEMLIDVNRQVSDWIGGTPAFDLYRALIPLLFAVIAPLWFLLARSSRRRIGGLMALVGSAVILDLVVVGLSYRGDLPPIVWISFFPYTVSVLLAVALAVLLYRGVHPGSGARGVA